MQSIVERLTDTAESQLPSKDECLRILEYTQSLPEPQRTILQHRMNGMKAREIAKAMQLRLDVVCRSLAKSYCDLSISTFG